MGLLIGNIEESTGIARIWAVTVVPRLQLATDRVEVCPEAMCEALTYAERLTHQTGMESRVLGWYHSHPRFTPWPSDVDLATQARYQQLDPWWVGLIFAVFNPDGKTASSLHGFQTNTRVSPDASYQDRHLLIPCHIIPYASSPCPSAPLAFDHTRILCDVLRQEAKDGLTKRSHRYSLDDIVTKRSQSLSKNGHSVQKGSEEQTLPMGAQDQQQLNQRTYLLSLQALHVAEDMRDMVQDRLQQLDQKITEMRQHPQSP